MKITKKQSRILENINLVNSMIKEVNEMDIQPFTYAGGTWPYLVLIKPIKVKNQFVTIENDGGTFIDKKERYNINKASDFNDNFCLGHLDFTVKLILKTFKKAYKENQKVEA
jgi:hypothetical protein